MAQPAGSITPGDGGYVATTDPGWSYAYFGFRLPFQPPHWRGGDTEKKHRAVVAFCASVPAGRTMDDMWIFKGEGWDTIELAATTTTGNVDAAWQVRDETPVLHGYESGYPALSDPSTLPHYCPGYVKFQRDAVDDVEITGVYLEVVDNDAYTDPEPSGARDVEQTDRGANKVYGPDEPASAWHAQWVLCHSLNKICYEARQCWSVPI